MAETLASMHDKVEAFLNRTDITDANKTVLLNMALHDVERGQFIFGGLTVHHNFQGMQKRQYTSTDEQYITVPSSIKEFKWVKIDRQGSGEEGRFFDLAIKDPAVALSMYPYDDAVTGRPTMFSLFPAQGEIGVFPYPDQSYKYDICFYAFTADLADDADTNWWLTNAYEIILFGALYMARLFLPDDGRVAEWKKAYDDAVWKLIQEEKAEESSGGRLIIEAYMPSQLSGGDSFDIDIIA